MGLLDSILGSKKPAPPAELPPVTSTRGPPFSLAISFRPVRLNARAENSVDMLVDLHSVASAPQMCSLVVELPKGLGFDNVGLHKTRELRLGEIGAGEKKEIPVGIFGTNQTPPGSYRLTVTAYAHYRDYTHVLNSASKTVELRVV